MPIYEYECQGCHRRVSLLVRSISQQTSPRCPGCGSAELSRLMSRFATLKSDDDRMEAAADPSNYGDLDENDPRSVAKYVKRMGEEMGEDLGPDLDAAMDEALDEGGLGDKGPDGETSFSEAGSGDES